MHNNGIAFFDYTWGKAMSADKGFVKFHAKLNKIASLDMKDKLKGQLLLRQAQLVAMTGASSSALQEMATHYTL